MSLPEAVMNILGNLSLFLNVSTNKSEAHFLDQYILDFLSLDHLPPANGKNPRISWGAILSPAKCKIASSS